MAAQLQGRVAGSSAVAGSRSARQCRPALSRRQARVMASADTGLADAGFKKMREGIKVADDETVLTPRVSSQVCRSGTHNHAHFWRIICNGTFIGS